MIHHADRPNETVVSDARGCVAAFGSVFVLSGLFSLSIAALNPDPEAPRLVFAVVGLGHLAGGLFIGWGESRTATVTRRGVRIVHRRLGRRNAVEDVPAASVDAVEVVEGRDSDGDPTFAPALRLTTRDLVPLTAQTVPMPGAALDAAQAVARRLGIPERVEW